MKRLMREAFCQKRAMIRSQILVSGIVSLCCVGLLFLRPAAFAQGSAAAETFKARLSPVPINISMMTTIAGTGGLTATLSGNKLTIQGTFEGLKSAATTAHIHRAPKAIPGPVVGNLGLTVSKAAKGTVSGTVELTPDQIADLRNGLWYVQIESEGAPDGNLWGWLLR